MISADSNFGICGGMRERESELAFARRHTFTLPGDRAELALITTTCYDTSPDTTSAIDIEAIQRPSKPTLSRCGGQCCQQSPFRCPSPLVVQLASAAVRELLIFILAPKIDQCSHNDGRYLAGHPRFIRILLILNIMLSIDLGISFT